MPNQRNDDRSRYRNGRRDDPRGRDEDYDRRLRGRADELPSVGSPGIGGGTGGQWDRDPSERDRGGDELRFERGGDRGDRWEQDRYGRPAYGRDDRDVWRDERGWREDGRPMSSSDGWGHDIEGGRGREEDWSPGQTGAERIGRHWGGDVGRTPDPMHPYGEGRHRIRGDRERERGRGHPMAPGAAQGFAGRGPMNYTRPDHRILEDVCDHLTEDDEVDASAIDVKVEQCEVTLTGMVASRHMKRRAEELAEHVPGVKDVHNQLKVKKQN